MEEPRKTPDSNKVLPKWEQRMDWSFPMGKISSIFKELENNNIVAWLDGGWAVDVMAGEQTRQHQDLDLIISANDYDQVKGVLEKMGFVVDEKETELPHRLVMVSPEEQQEIDAHIAVFKEDGTATIKITTYDRGQTGQYEYSYGPAAFKSSGEIDGQTVPCVSLEEQARSRIERPYFHDDQNRVRLGGVSVDLHDLEIIDRLLKKDAGDRP